MSYPSGPPGGYPGQAQQQGGSVFGQPPAAQNPLASLGIPGLLTLGITVLSLAAYFCSFGGGAGFEVWTLLAGGLLALLSLAPKAPDTLPFAGVLSVVGGLGVLAGVIDSGYTSTSEILILVFGLLQAVVAVAAVLLHYDMIKLAPRQAVPHNPGYPGGGYQQQQQPPAGQHQQATTYMSAPPPAPQSTQFLQHPGQLNHPANPPGGNGNE